MMMPKNRLISGTRGHFTAQPAGNSGQCATASLAFTATMALWNL
jgi:hypothetical protein